MSWSQIEERLERKRAQAQERMARHRSATIKVMPWRDIGFFPPAGPSNFGIALLQPSAQLLAGELTQIVFLNTETALKEPKMHHCTLVNAAPPAIILSRLLTDYNKPRCGHARKSRTATVLPLARLGGEADALGPEDWEKAGFTEQSWGLFKKGAARPLLIENLSHK
ncbi:hypothetical protein B0H17DRAFT_1128784 [Mycena rosella]|uniref:Uncharacterized protein n=1 Tax=Mycena rosella TaxID=1033263 RepID=A0AAD7DX62_MYCRO|nr:hypothetical protein B0H17DRAFT_1128784 [Mycena rosella]